MFISIYCKDVYEVINTTSYVSKFQCVLFVDGRMSNWYSNIRYVLSNISVVTICILNFV